MFVASYIAIDQAIAEKSHLFHCQIGVDRYKALLAFILICFSTDIKEFKSLRRKKVKQMYDLHKTTKIYYNNESIQKKDRHIFVRNDINFSKRYKAIHFVDMKT